MFNLDVQTDPNTPQPQYEKPLRYGKLAEINHIFKADPKSGPLVISLFFVLAVLAAVPILFGTVSCAVRIYHRFLLIFDSGHISVPTLITSRKLPPQLQFLTVYSSAQSSVWKLYSSSTTTTGVSLRCYHSLVLLDW